MHEENLLCIQLTKVTITYNNQERIRGKKITTIILKKKIYGKVYGLASTYQHPSVTHLSTKFLLVAPNCLAAPAPIHLFAVSLIIV